MDKKITEDSERMSKVREAIMSEVREAIVNADIKKLYALVNSFYEKNIQLECFETDWDLVGAYKSYKKSSAYINNKEKKYNTLKVAGADAENVLDELYHFLKIKRNQNDLSIQIEQAEFGSEQLECIFRKISEKARNLYINNATDAELLELCIEINYGTHNTVYAILDRLLEINQKIDALCDHIQLLTKFYQAVYRLLLNDLNELIDKKEERSILLKTINEKFNIEVDYTVPSANEYEETDLCKKTNLFHCIILENFIFSSLASIRYYFFDCLEFIFKLPDEIAIGYVCRLQSKLDVFSCLTNPLFSKGSFQQWTEYRDSIKEINITKLFPSNEGKKLVNFFHLSNKQIDYLTYNTHFFRFWVGNNKIENSVLKSIISEWQSNAVCYFLPIFIHRMIDYKISTVVNIKQSEINSNLEEKISLKKERGAHLLYNLVRCQILFYDNDIALINELSILCCHMLEMQSMDQSYLLLYILKEHFIEKLYRLINLTAVSAKVKDDVLKFINYCILQLVEEGHSQESKEIVEVFEQLYCNLVNNAQQEIFESIKKRLDFNQNEKEIELSVVDVSGHSEENLFIKNSNRTMTGQYANAFEQEISYKNIEINFTTKNTSFMECLENQHAILSVSGGGIRGLIPALVAEEIEKRVRGPLQNYFDTMIGTSTGGIIAAGLAKENPLSAKEIVNIYHGDKRNVIFPPSCLIKNIALTKYSRNGIDSVLKSVFRENDFTHTKTDLLMTAFYRKKVPNIITKKRTKWFKRPFYKDSMNVFEDCLFTNNGIYEVADNACVMPIKPFFPDVVKLWDACGATSSAPTYFPDKRIKDSTGFVYHFYDGGLGNNDPAYTGYDYVTSIRGVKKDNIFLVSLGTGIPLANPSVGLAGNNHLNKINAAWAKALIEKLFNAANNKEELLKAVIPEEKRYLLQTKFPGDIELDAIDEKSMSELWRIAMEYIEHNTDTLNKLSEKLLRGKEIISGAEFDSNYVDEPEDDSDDVLQLSEDLSEDKKIFSDGTPDISLIRKNIGESKSSIIEVKTKAKSKEIRLAPLVTRGEIYPYCKPGRCQVSPNDFTVIDKAIMRHNAGIYVDVLDQGASLSKAGSTAYSNKKSVYILRYTLKSRTNKEWVLSLYPDTKLSFNQLKSLYNLIQDKSLVEIKNNHLEEIKKIISNFHTACIKDEVYKALIKYYKKHRVVPKIGTNLLKFKLNRIASNHLHYPFYTAYHAHQPIFYAAAIGHGLALKFLHEIVGESLEIKGERNWSLLHWAAANNETEIIYYLYRKCMEKNNCSFDKLKEFLLAKNSTRRTALYLSESPGRRQLQAAELLRYLMGIIPVGAEIKTMSDNAKLQISAQPVSNSKSIAQEKQLNFLREHRLENFIHSDSEDIKLPYVAVDHALYKAEVKLFDLWDKLVSIPSNTKSKSTSSLLVKSGEKKVSKAEVEKSISFSLRAYNAALYNHLNKNIRKIENCLYILKYFLSEWSRFCSPEMILRTFMGKSQFKNEIAYMARVCFSAVKKVSEETVRQRITKYIKFFHEKYKDLIIKKQVIALCEVHPNLRFIHYVLQKQLNSVFRMPMKEYIEANLLYLTLFFPNIKSIPGEFKNTVISINNKKLSKIVQSLSSFDLKAKTVESIADVVILKYYPLFIKTTFKGCVDIADYCAARITSYLINEYEFNAGTKKHLPDYVSDSLLMKWKKNKLPRELIKNLNKKSKITLDNIVDESLSIFELFYHSTLVNIEGSYPTFFIRSCLSEASLICFAGEKMQSYWYFHQWEKMIKAGFLPSAHKESLTLYKSLCLKISFSSNDSANFWNEEIDEANKSIDVFIKKIIDDKVPMQLLLPDISKCETYTSMPALNNSSLNNLEETNSYQVPISFSQVKKENKESISLQTRKLEVEVEKTTVIEETTGEDSLVPKTKFETINNKSFDLKSQLSNKQEEPKIEIFLEKVSEEQANSLIVDENNQEINEGLGIMQDIDDSNSREASESYIPTIRFGDTSNALDNFELEIQEITCNLL